MTSFVPKLYYFDLPGRGEVIRLALHATQTPFEDVRLSFEEWAKVKTTLSPSQQLPCFEYEKDKKLTESLAILTYVAASGKLIPPQHSIESTRCTEITLICNEIIESIIPIYSAKDEEEKARVTKIHQEQNVPQLLNRLEKILQETESKENGFACGGKLSVADIAIFDKAHNCKAYFFDFDASKYPHIARCVQTVGEVEGIKKYLASRK